MPARARRALAWINGVHDVAPKVVGEVTPVGRTEQDEICALTGRDPSAVGQTEDVRGVDGARGERFGGH